MPTLSSLGNDYENPLGSTVGMQAQTFAPVTNPASMPTSTGGYMKKPDPTIPQLNVPQQTQPMMIRAAS
jgi:hypothetical protein